MSLFDRSCKDHRTTSCPRCGRQDSLHNTIQSLKSALQHHKSSVPMRTDSSSPTSRNSGLVYALGLVALTGVALYATRKPAIPQGVEPVENFDLQRYLGKWYEVARIEHSFEKGLQRTQAEYSLAQDGSIFVTNRGYDPKRGEWKVSHGKAKPTIAPDVAALKVSFFGPFYSGYNVVALCKDYQWAMVIGSSLDYFWILSRQPSLPNGVEDRLLEQARTLGVDTQKILWVHQDGVNPTGNYK